MADSQSDAAESIVERFVQAWENHPRPLIVDFLRAASDDHRTHLMARLVSIDVERRQADGELVQPTDYLQLGAKAVETARRKLVAPAKSVDMSLEMTMDSGLTAGAREPVSKTTGLNDVPAGNEPKVAFSETPSSFIGPYKLLQKIGEGGMGTVWMAEQRQPVRRRVALKVIRAEIGSNIAIARFEAERQAVAIMDHQNIARILDAGTTPDGNPFFVMELVNGVPLNKYCDKRKLNIRQRLELMIPVCRAIQHAHQKGIIHRDLKHSNVLVTHYDDRPVPKVIDFGLAKSFEDQQKLTDRTMFTEFGKVVGTLQYMSPEQAEMSGVDVDTRSDIYSLGVMLYKLLTGGTPLDDETLSSNSFLQVLELIREKEPLRPSAKILAMDKTRLEQHADDLSLRPERIVQQVQGDVDWILLKALDKDRSRRYETANGLALDIERYLRDEIVSASPPSAAYRFHKMYHRNRGLFTTAIACTVLLALGMIGTVLGLVSALKERDRANAKTVEAMRESERALQAEQAARRATSMAQARLHAIKIKSAWSDWQLGNVESALQMLNSLGDSEMGWESEFLQTEFASSQYVLYGHALHVVTVDNSPDGKFIATASDDNTMKIWDAATKQLLHTCVLTEEPTQVCFSGNSQTVACSDLSNQVSFWSVATGKQERPPLGPFQEDITAIAYLNSGNQMLLGTSDKDSCGAGRNNQQFSTEVPIVRIVDLHDGSVIVELVGHTKEITAVIGSGDGSTILSSSLDETIRIWKAEEGEFVIDRILKAHTPGVSDLDVSPSGKLFASCGKDSTIRLWEMESGSLLETFVGHLDNVNAVEFSPNGQFLVSASTDRTGRVWNLRGEELLNCRGHFDEVNDASFAADGREILTVSSDKTVRAWEATSKPSTCVVHGHSEVVWQADFSPDGNKVVSAGEDATVCIIDTRSGELVCEKLKHGDAVLSIAHSPVADIFVTGDAEAKLRVFSSTDGQLLKTIDAHEGFIWDVSFSTDGRLLVTASSDHTVKVWDTDEWTVVKHFEAHDGELGSARFSNDGRFIVTAGDDRNVKLWDAESCDLLHTFQGHRHTVWRAVFSPSGNVIASSGYDGEIIVWDVASRAKIRTLDGHQDQIAGLAFTADGSRIVTASDDQTIKFWDLQSGIELFVLRDKGDSAIVHASFSRDGKKLVSGNQFGWVTIRSTSDSAGQAKTFLPQDAVENMTNGLLEVTGPNANDTVYLRELNIAQKCCYHFPSYLSFTIVGIAEYRLGNFKQAISALKEAQRIEPLEYGEPDLIPNIEAYLTLSLVKNGQLNEARSIHKLFAEKAKKTFWSDNDEIEALQAEIRAAFHVLGQPIQ